MMIHADNAVVHPGNSDRVSFTPKHELAGRDLPCMSVQGVIHEQYLPKENSAIVPSTVKCLTQPPYS